MNICIFGAGAIGGHMGAKLLHAGVENVSVVARGPMLAAIRSKGLTLRSEGKEFHGKPKVATDDPSTLPPQDVVLVTLKATAGLPAAADAIGRLIAPGGCAVFMTNGIPWWWRHGMPGKAETLPLLDPQGALWKAVKPERVIGCVVYAPTEAVEPGVLVHVGQNFLVFGEPDNSSSERLAKVVDLFKRAGVDARPSKDLRNDIWRKLTQNASGNTVCALTRTDLGGMGLDAGLRSVSMGIMKEVMAVATAQGWDFRSEVDCEAIAKRGKPGQRPSMLQDALAGRPMECEALLGQVQAFARELSIPTPTADVVLPLLRGLDAAQQRAK
jgi:2-dehydropantoate 2-reductase